jgi:hypothetical protein
MCLQGEEMKIDVKNIEEEFQFHGLQASKSPPKYWRNLGSSKTRTKEQEIKGRDFILQKITETTDICLSVVSFLLHLSSWFLMGIFIEYELFFPMSLMVISSLLKSKGITPDITSIASRLVVDGKPRIIDNPFLCTVFNLSRLSLFPICHTQLAYCKTEPIKLL